MTADPFFVSYFPIAIQPLTMPLQSHPHVVL